MIAIIKCSYSALVPIEDLKLKFNPKNRNVHSKEQIERLAQILKYQGARYCAKISMRSGLITSGHGRILAAERAGWTEYPVDYQDYEDDAQEYADMTADNSIAAWAELDFAGINADLGDLGPDFDVDMLGIEDFKIDVADKVPPGVANEGSGSGDNDKADEIPDHIEPRVKPGEVYHVGVHTVMNGDCLAVLKTMPDCSVDSLVTDPPAGISFMGKEWDDDKGGSKQWTAWLKEVMAECLRVLKPGAHGLVWAIPRTSHWTATALEDAGFEIRDVVTHLFGSGFPKSLDISKAIDKANGNERDIIGSNGTFPRMNSGKYGAHAPGKYEMGRSENNITAPSSDEAKQWEGWGTALKPASEHWILVRKPCSEDTVAANVLKHGTGGINIDAGRIGYQSDSDFAAAAAAGDGKMKGVYSVDWTEGKLTPQNATNILGRFPANLVLSHNHDCVEAGEGWVCTSGCPIAMLDEQSGERGNNHRPNVKKHRADNKGMFGLLHSGAAPSDSGGASRFFYCSKPSKRERNEGCEALPETHAPHGSYEGRNLDNPKVHLGGMQGTVARNFHPTIKPTKLMSYFITLITPPDGIVLDPFGGSGTTLVAAHSKGFASLLIEQSPEYCDIILARAEHVTEKSAMLMNSPRILC